MRAGLNLSSAVRYRSSVSLAALLIGGGAASPVMAETFYVSNYTQLYNAVSAANASSDSSSTIILTQDITTTGNLVTVTKNLRIDTNGFTINGITAIPSALNGFTLEGTFRGATQAGTGGTAFTQGTLTGASVITNSGSIFGGLSTGAAGGLGVSISAATFTNYGSVFGGDGTINGGNAVQVRRTSTVINYGLIQGGSAADPSGFGAAGVDLGGPSGLALLTNYGMIRGGAGAANSPTASGGIGVFTRVGSGQIFNGGTIEGVGAMAIMANAATVSLDIVNSGKIIGGAGANAIGWLPSSPPTTGKLSLELRAGSEITGNVVANSGAVGDILRLSGADNWVLTGGIGSTSQYQNFDTLEKTGASTWTLNGSGDFAGPTNVLAGKLVVNGSLANSAVTVASGAILGGYGTVGVTTIASGGTIAPGNSIGTLTVNGAFVQAGGATYQVEVDPATETSDLIAVNGTATLASGANLNVINYTGAAFSPGQRYTILTSAALTGTYSTAEQVLGPFLTLRNSYDATNAYLTVVQTGNPGSVGTTPNEVEVGKGVDSLPNGSSVHDGMLNQPSIDAAQRALNQLSGEIHSSAKSALIEESWLLRAAINDRLRTAFGGVGAGAGAGSMSYSYNMMPGPGARGAKPAPAADGFTVWAQGYGAFGKTDGDGNAAKLKRSTGGFLIGADAAAFDDWRFGAVAGYTHSDFNISDRLSSGQSDNYHLGAYAGSQWGALNLRTGASYTWHDLETHRVVTSAFIASRPSASYAAASAQVFGELGYRVDVGRVALEPYAALAYVNLHTEGFREISATTALTGQGDDAGIGYSTLGLRASSGFDLRGMVANVRGGLGWRHAEGDFDPKTTMAFVGSTSFTIAGVPIARDAAVVEARLDVVLGRGATLGVAYTSQLAEDAQDHSFKGVLAVKF